MYYLYDTETGEVVCSDTLEASAGQEKRFKVGQIVYFIDEWRAAKTPWEAVTKGITYCKDYVHFYKDRLKEAKEQLEIWQARLDKAEERKPFFI